MQNDTFKMFQKMKYIKSHEESAQMNTGDESESVLA